MKLLKTLRVKVPPEDITDPELEWGEQEVKLHSQVIHNLDNLSIKNTDDNIKFKNLTDGETNLPYKTSIMVYGDSDKYYPVHFARGNQNLQRTIKIWRTHSMTAPDDWYTSTHKGSINLVWKGNYGGWGGAVYTSTIEENTSQYTKLLARVENVDNYYGVAFYLRGGGAIYHIASDQPLSWSDNYLTYSSPTAFYNQDLTFVHSNSSYNRRAGAPLKNIDSKLKSIEVAKFDEIYPIGSIYISVNNTNPSSLFGGTWAAFATGRTLVGVDTSQTEFNTVQKTGGHKSLQSHTHTISIGAAGAHTHSVSGTAASDGAHSHTITVNSGGAHTHSVSGSTNSTGSHTHSTQGWLSNQSGSNDRAVITRNRISADPVDSTGVIRPAGAHSHTVTGTAESGGSHSHTASSNSTGAHTHTVSGTAASAGSHTHGATAASEGAGDSQNLQPYITVYMWRRTA